MANTKLIDLLKNGECLYLNYVPTILPSFSPKIPGTKDDYTHYIYLDQKTGFFFEFDKKSQKVYQINTHHLQNILKDLELEQKNVKSFLNQTI